jgi:hypothetical protein
MSAASSREMFGRREWVHHDVRRALGWMLLTERHCPEYEAIDGMEVELLR